MRGWSELEVEREAKFGKREGRGFLPGLLKRGGSGSGDDVIKTYMLRARCGDSHSFIAGWKASISSRRSRRF